MLLYELIVHPLKEFKEMKKYSVNTLWFTTGPYSQKAVNVNKRHLTCCS